MREEAPGPRTGCIAERRDSSPDPMARGVFFGREGTTVAAVSRLLPEGGMPGSLLPYHGWQGRQLAGMPSVADYGPFSRRHGTWLLRTASQTASGMSEHSILHKQDFHDSPIIVDFPFGHGTPVQSQQSQCVQYFNNSTFARPPRGCGPLLPAARRNYHGIASLVWLPCAQLPGPRWQLNNPVAACDY